MKPVVLNFLENAHQVNTLDELNLLFENTINELGFSSWAHLSVPDESILKFAKPLVFANYDEEWLTRYFDQNYMNIDPIVENIKNSTTAFQWQQATNEISLNKEQKDFMGEAKDFGLADGLAIPIHGVGAQESVVSLVSQEEGLDLTKTLAETSTEIQLISQIYHNLSTQLFYADQNITSDTEILTKREYEILSWYTSGKTGWEISKILNISEATVKFHFGNIKKKFGVFSMSHAVVKAMLKGILKHF